MTGVDLFVEELKARGVPFVATLCGHGLDPFDAACAKAGMRLVDVRNEQAAAYMAEATGRLTRGVGVCAVSSGVAHANALTGVQNAWFDGAPMLLLSGSGPLSTMGLGHFQDLDQVATARPICKYARLVDRVERIPQIVGEAFAAALGGRPGPVHLTFPMDVMGAQAAVESAGRGRSSRREAAQGGIPDAGAIGAVVDLLAKAERPLLVAGSGVYYAKGEAALEAFAAGMAVPVVVPIWDRGSVTNRMAPFMGVIGAATGGPRLLPDADLVILAGARTDYRVGYLQSLGKGARVVRIDRDAGELGSGVEVDVAVQASPSLALAGLLEACRKRGLAPFKAWLADASSRRDAHRTAVREMKRAGAGLHALDVVSAVEKAMTDDTTLVVDGGNIGQWVHQTLCDRYPGHWLTCGASGVVGYGIPAAMAARVLYPERPVILVSGDGSFGFTPAELEPASRQGVGFLAIVADDEAWGITLTGHEQKYGRGYTSELGPLAYDRLAEALGAKGARAGTAKELEVAVREGLKDRKRPTVVHARIARSNPTV